MIATYRPEGIERVVAMELPRVEGVEYVVSWQAHGNQPLPAALEGRGDVRVVRYDGSTLSGNRNMALDSSHGDICLVADDDLRYTTAQLRAVVDTFATHPEVDMALFRYEGTGKRYPEVETDLERVPPFFFPTSFEMAFRRQLGAERGLRFNPFFGLNAPYLTAGEDDILFRRAQAYGLRRRFFPVTITRHEGPTTGERRVTDPGVLRSTGALIHLDHPATSWLRIPLNAWRVKRAGRCGLLKAVLWMAQGAVYIARNRNMLLSAK